MKILSVNAGSSSLKFTAFEMPEEKVLMSGYFERIGISGSFYTIKYNGMKEKKEVELKSHTDAFSLLIEELLFSGELKLPVDMGQIRIYKKENKPVIKDGKVYYNAPIDWNKTLELWSTDNESKIAKTLVKVSPGDIYTFKYKHHYSKFKNKEYYIFKFNRQLKLSLKDKIVKRKEIPYFSQFKKLN